MRYAEDLVRLVRRLGDFCVGVAAFPYGHPRSADLDADLARLLAKIRAGADFAISQLFLEPEGFLRLRDRLAAAGCEVPLLPGIMPLTTVRTLHRGPELSGAPLPDGLLARLEPLRRRPGGPSGRPGWTSPPSCAARLLAEGVRGLHFYTLNRSTATVELVRRLGLDGVAAAAGQRPRAADRRVAGLPGVPDGAGRGHGHQRAQPERPVHRRRRVGVVVGDHGVEVADLAGGERPAHRAGVGIAVGVQHLTRER